MLLQKNTVNASSFAKADWKKAFKKGRARELNAAALAWLCTPHGDHGLGSAVLEPLLLQAGLAKKGMGLNLERIAHNLPLAGYGDGRVLDLLIETDTAKYAAVLPVSLDALRPGDNGSLLKDVTAWLADNLAPGKRTVLLAVVPVSGDVPADVHDEIRTSGYVRTVSLARLAEILEKLLDGTVTPQDSPRFYAALERYVLFLRTYLLDVHGGRPLDIRLKNLRALL